MPFEMTFHVAWAHLDANGHMANTAYLDIAVGVPRQDGRFREARVERQEMTDQARVVSQM